MERADNMAAYDFKKEYNDLYVPKTIPGIVSVPTMRFIKVDGKGDPNTSPLYKAAVEVLYGLSYSIKVSRKNGQQLQDYVVPPWRDCGGSRMGISMAVLLAGRANLAG